MRLLKDMSDVVHIQYEGGPADTRFTMCEQNYRDIYYSLASLREVFKQTPTCLWCTGVREL